MSLKLTATERRVCFSVSDDGLGIPHAEQRRIFDKFYRLDPNMTRGIGGTGLGLYICRELVRRMNGRIWVTSEPAAARRSPSSCPWPAPSRPPRARSKTCGSRPPPLAECS